MSNLYIAALKLVSKPKVKDIVNDVTAKEVISVPPKPYDPKNVTNVFVRAPSLCIALDKAWEYVKENPEALSEVVKVEKVLEITID